MQRHLPDVVLLDLVMHGLEGVSVLQFMRASEQLQDIPVVITAAQELPGERVRLLSDNRIVIDGPEGWSISDVLGALQAVLDVLPPSTPVSPPLLGSVTVQPAQRAS